MRRFSPLRVDQLEDRCVPTTDPLVQTATLVADAGTVTVVEASTLDATAGSFVIDPPLIDPNAPPPPTSTDPSPPPPTFWNLPLDPGLIPPIAPPIWY